MAAITSIRELVTERTGDTDRDVEAILNAYSRTLEYFVRAAPEQYFWQHRRWKRQPASTPPELAIRYECAPVAEATR